MKKSIGDEEIRVIKISKDAIFEFIYEEFITKQEELFEIDALDVMNSFEIDWENGQFIFCVHKFEDASGNIISFPKEIDLKRLMRMLPDTTSSMYKSNRYQEYTKDELKNLLGEEVK